MSSKISTKFSAFFILAVGVSSLICAEVVSAQWFFFNWGGSPQQCDAPECRQTAKSQPPQSVADKPAVICISSDDVERVMDEASRNAHNSTDDAAPVVAMIDNVADVDFVTVPVSSGDSRRVALSSGASKSPEETTAANPPATPNAAAAPMFQGVDSDKWEEAVRAVCEQRGIPISAIYKALNGRTISCSTSYRGAYAGCTWGGDGFVSKVDIVPSNCYDVEPVRRHEAAHVVTFLIDGASSLFVHEGVSQICERGGKRRTYLSKAGRQMSESTNFIDWVDVNSYDSAYRVYSYSFAVFEYLREVGGSHWLEGFVHDASKSSFTDALYRWYNLTPKDLNANVRELIERDTVRPII